MISWQLQKSLTLICFTYLHREIMEANVDRIRAEQNKRKENLIKVHDVIRDQMEQKRKAELRAKQMRENDQIIRIQ